MPCPSTPRQRENIRKELIHQVSKEFIATSSLNETHKGEVVMIDCKEEAQTCRVRALSYLGKPEAPFLLSVARAFDDLSAGRRLQQQRR